MHGIKDACTWACVIKISKWTLYKVTVAKGLQ